MKRMMGGFVVGAALMLAGCTGTVQVVDVRGIPVSDAEVSAVTASMRGQPVRTDGNGEAEVGTWMAGQETTGVAVWKSGFEPVSVGVPEKWPLRVVLPDARAAAPRPVAPMPVQPGPAGGPGAPGGPASSGGAENGAPQ